MSTSASRRGKNVRKRNKSIHAVMTNVVAQEIAMRFAYNRMPLLRRIVKAIKLAVGKF